MSKIDHTFQALCREILQDGREYENKNRGVKRLQIPSYTLRHSFKDGFPAITNKKLYWKGIVTEALWFLNGDTDVKYLNDNGVTIWNQDAYNWYKKHFDMTNEHPENVYSDGEGLLRMLTFEEFSNIGKGSVGANYSKQWRDFCGVDQIKRLIEDMEKDIMSSRLKVNAWNPAEIFDTALPPCFTKETLVCTSEGYKVIQDIKISDKVLTKEGVFEEVYDKMETPYNGTLIGFDLKGKTDLIKCTPNHKFWIKDKGWIQSLDIEEGDFMGLPINTKSEIPQIFFVKKKNQIDKEGQKLSTNMSNIDLWWVMGYFLGDGWIRKDRNDVSFAVADEELDIILPNLRKVFKNLTLGQRTGKCQKYTVSSVEFHNLLKKFGQGAKNKFIPQFVVDAPIEYVEKFLEGYRMADGTKTKESFEAGTISESIAYGLQILLAKVGKPSSVCKTKRKAQKEIEGRLIKQNEFYYIIKEYSKNINFTSVLQDEEFIWFEVQNKHLFKNIECNVYNLSVRNSNTYTVFNSTTKNCHSEFQVIGVPLSFEERYRLYFDAKDINGEPMYYHPHYDNESTPQTDEEWESLMDESIVNVPKFGFELHWNQRSVDTFLGLPFNIASYGLLAKILEAVTGYPALGIEGTLKCVHFYDNQYQAVEELLKRDPDTHAKCEITLPDVPRKVGLTDFQYFGYYIDAVRPQHFKLVGYTSDEAIKVDMLAPTKI